MPAAVPTRCGLKTVWDVAALYAFSKGVVAQAQEFCSFCAVECDLIAG